MQTEVEDQPFLQTLVILRTTTFEVTLVDVNFAPGLNLEAHLASCRLNTVEDASHNCSDSLRLEAGAESGSTCTSKRLQLFWL